MLIGYCSLVIIETLLLVYWVNKDLELDNTMVLLCFLVSLTVLIVPLFTLIIGLQELYFKFKK